MWTKERLGGSTARKLTLVKSEYEIVVYYDLAVPNIYAVSLYNIECHKSLMTSNLDIFETINALKCLQVTSSEIKQALKLLF